MIALFQCSRVSSVSAGQWLGGCCHCCWSRSGSPEHLLQPSLAERVPGGVQAAGPGRGAPCPPPASVPDVQVGLRQRGRGESTPWIVDIGSLPPSSAQIEIFRKRLQSAAV